jgi:hypothetical protein
MSMLYVLAMIWFRKHSISREIDVKVASVVTPAQDPSHFSVLQVFVSLQTLIN